MTTDLSTQDRTWSRLQRVTGAVGLAAIVLVFASVITIGEGEPPPLASVEEAARYFRDADSAWLQPAFALP